MIYSFNFLKFRNVRCSESPFFSNKYFIRKKLLNLLNGKQLEKLLDKTVSWEKDLLVSCTFQDNFKKSQEDNEALQFLEEKNFFNDNIKTI